MPQQFLNYSNVHAAVERMGRKRMPEQVRVNVFFQSRPLADRAYNALNGTRLERLVGRFTAHKQAGAALAGYHILLHHQAGANGKIHLPILITLAGDAHRAADEVKIGSAELRDLAQTAAGGYQKFHECLFAVAPAGIGAGVPVLQRSAPGGHPSCPA